MVKLRLVNPTTRHELSEASKNAIDAMHAELGICDEVLAVIDAFNVCPEMPCDDHGLSSNGIERALKLRYIGFNELADEYYATVHIEEYNEAYVAAYLTGFN